MLHSEIVAKFSSFDAYATASLGEVVVRLQFALEVLTILRDHGAEVDSVSFWCDCSLINRARYGCPHGGGGYGYSADGAYYSELYWIEPRYFELNEATWSMIEYYIKFEVRHEDFFRDCLALGFLLRSNGSLTVA